MDNALCAAEKQMNESDRADPWKSPTWLRAPCWKPVARMPLKRNCAFVARSTHANLNTQGVVVGGGVNIVMQKGARGVTFSKIK